MRKQIYETGFKLWLSQADVYDWVNKPEASWPCSSIEGKSLFVEFDSNGLVDISDGDIMADELNAIVADHICYLLPDNHCCNVFMTPLNLNK